MGGNPPYRPTTLVAVEPASQEPLSSPLGQSGLAVERPEPSAPGRCPERLFESAETCPARFLAFSPGRSLGRDTPVPCASCGQCWGHRHALSSPGKCSPAWPSSPYALCPIYLDSEGRFVGSPKLSLRLIEITGCELAPVPYGQVLGPFAISSMPLTNPSSPRCLDSERIPLQRMPFTLVHGEPEKYRG